MKHDEVTGFGAAFVSELVRVLEESETSETAEGLYGSETIERMRSGAISNEDIAEYINEWNRRPSCQKQIWYAVTPSRDGTLWDVITGPTSHEG